MDLRPQPRDAARRRYHKGSSDGKRAPSHDPLASVRSSYDVLVVGSGLGGLTAANVLGRAGYKVALFEQHYNFGGLATWFKRKGGHVFDISLHGFPIGMKKTCRKYWNVDIAGRIVQLDGVRFENPQFAFDTQYTREDFTSKLTDVMGVPAETVQAFYEHLRRMNYYDESTETIADLFERFFPGRNDVHRLLLEPISYANGSTLEDPAIAYGIVFSNFMSKGIYTFQGGTDWLVKAMKAELVKNGVELYNHSQVEQVAVEGGCVKGLVVNGRLIEAPIVVSNASISTTIQRLVGEQHFDADFLAEAQAVRLNNSSTQVYMGLEPGSTLPFVGDLLFTSTRPSFTSEALCEMDGLSRTFSFYYPKTRPGTDRYTVVSSTNALWEDWNALDDAQYQAAKERLIADTIDCLETKVPGVRSKIEHVEAATPRTFAFYTQSPQGTSFGTKFEGLAVSAKLPQAIPGLFHTGSVGIIMSGWLGAANYGAIIANKVDAWMHERSLQPA